jgi:hypothetical protein
MESKALKTLGTWSRTRNGCPVFRSTEDAIFFANIIWDMEQEQDMLKLYLQDLQIKLEYQREKDKPNWNYCSTLASQCQFLRECVAECQRIKDEPFRLSVPINKRFNTDIRPDEEVEE